MTETQEVGTVGAIQHAIDARPSNEPQGGLVLPGNAAPPNRRPGTRMALATPMEMLAFAISKGHGVEIIKQLMDLQERWQKSEALRAFNNAIADAKAEFPRIVKSSHVTFEAKENQGKDASKKDPSKDTDYWHETLDGIADQIDPILHKYGLGYRFETDSTPGPANERGEATSSIKVTCVILHRDGHEVRNSLNGPRDTTGSKNSHQAIASALTYLQRYALKAALGLSAARRDDDGQAAEEAGGRDQAAIGASVADFAARLAQAKARDDLKKVVDDINASALVDALKPILKPYVDAARTRTDPNRVPTPEELVANSQKQP